jgi:hypothetical protein
MTIAEMIINLRNACRDEDIYCFSRLNTNALTKCNKIYEDSKMEQKSLLNLVEEYGATCSEVALASINKMISFDRFIQVVKKKEDKFKEIESLITTSQTQGVNHA